MDCSETSENTVNLMEEKPVQTSENAEALKLQTSHFYKVHQNLPARFNNPDGFHGYSQKKTHPLYQTSNQLYGSKKPTVHHMPTRFFGTSRRFSEDLLRGGMFQDSSLNTSLQNAPISFNYHHHHHGN